MADLDYITIGMVIDMLIEKNNDDYDYPVMGNDDDIARL